jgi:outer membrane protein OmpA-like peptidoglycan-associated protein
MKIGQTLLAVPLIAGLALSTGCVTKKVFRNTVQEEDRKIDSVQTGVEANERRVKDLDSMTKTEVGRLDAKTDAAKMRGDEAYTKAEAAEKLAMGKVLWEVTLSNDQVKFGLNEAQIPAESKAILDDLAVKVKQYNKAVYVEVQGHTDATGTDEYNMSLGQKRAEAVVRYLNEQAGIPLHLITGISYGESKPVAENGTRQGRAQNRRVVIRILE